MLVCFLRKNRKDVDMNGNRGGQKLEGIGDHRKYYTKKITSNKMMK